MGKFEKINKFYRSKKSRAIPNKNIQKGIGKSHSKIILMGEHSVVYGYPAIAIPLKNITIKCKIVNFDKTVENNKYRKFDKQRVDNTLSTAIYSALEYLGKENEIIGYKITSEIPSKRGMGSSAAVSICAIRAVFHYFNETLSNEVLEKLVDKAEKIAHNSPSGLDAKTCLSNSAIKFIKNVGFYPIELDLGCYLIIADTGIHGNTRDAIDNVKQLGDNAKQPLKKLGELTNEVEKNILNKDIISMGENMILAHNELKKLNVSVDKSDMLVEVALKSGALGAKMSGGGLGGCIIALAETKEKMEQVSKKLREKGATNIWIETL